MRYISFILIAIICTLTGCGHNSREYCGYIPVAHEEAVTLANQLMEKTSSGDNRWLNECCDDVDAIAAIYFIAGVDIPNPFKKPTQPEREAWKEQTAQMYRPWMESLSMLQLKEVKEMGNTQIVVFDFIFEKDGEKSPKDRQNYFTLLKHKKTGNVIIAGMGTKW